MQEPTTPFWTAGSTPAAIAEADPDSTPALTPYLLPDGPPTAAIVVCPGGGYGRRAPHEKEPIARWLNVLGIAAFVLEYRVAPHRHPAPLMDAQRAIRLVRHHAAAWNVAPDRVGILGFSAGGHLASSAGTIFDSGDPDAADPVERQSCRPDALVLCYPVITFGEQRHDGSMRNLLGDDPPADLRAALSTEMRVTPETPPTFLWHTVEDASVPVENSLLFAAALRRHAIPFSLHIYSHGRHGLGLATDETPDVATWTTLCANWLAGTL